MTRFTVTRSRVRDWLAGDEPRRSHHIQLGDEVLLNRYGTERVIPGGPTLRGVPPETSQPHQAPACEPARRAGTNPYGPILPVSKGVALSCATRPSTGQAEFSGCDVRRRHVSKR